MAPYEYDIIRPILDNEQIEGYDDELPLQLQTPSLKTYIDDLHMMQIKKDKEETEESAKKEAE